MIISILSKLQKDSLQVLDVAIEDNCLHLATVCPQFKGFSGNSPFLVSILYFISKFVFVDAVGGFDFSRPEVVLSCCIFDYLTPCD